LKESAVIVALLSQTRPEELTGCHMMSSPIVHQGIS